MMQVTDDGLHFGGDYEKAQVRPRCTEEGFQSYLSTDSSDITLSIVLLSRNR